MVDAKAVEKYNTLESWNLLDNFVKFSELLGYLQIPDNLSSIAKYDQFWLIL